MAKRDQGEPTQPLSASQILAAAPPKPPTVSKHDASVWRGLVVGADDFAPQKAKRGVPRWVIFGAIGAAVAGVAIALFMRGGTSTTAKTAPPPAPQAQVAPPAPAPADAMPMAAAAPPAPIDAAAAPDAAAETVDAVSAVAPVPAKPKPAVKKSIKKTKRAH